MAEKKGSSSEKTLYCSFCGKSQHEVKKLIAGPSVFICDECIDLCNEIIRDELPAGDLAREGRSDLPTPVEIKANLDNYVIGQDVAKRILAELNDSTLVISDTISFPSQDYGIAIPKGKADLKAKIDASIQRMQADGTIDALVKKWDIYGDAAAAEATDAPADAAATEAPATTTAQ